MKQIANLFTLLNLALGCMAIVCILQTNSIIIETNEQFVAQFDFPEKIALGALLLFAAAAVDFLDGFVARLTGQFSEMGKQLDSLCDMVSFGAAPALLLFQLLRLGFLREENGLDTSVVWLLPAFVFALAAAWRLARFNLDTSTTTGFRGVPTPAAALLVASLPLILHYGSAFPAINEWLVNQYVLYALIAVLSGLMVSKLPMMALKFAHVKWAGNQWRYLLIATALAAGITLHWLAVPVVFILYILFSFIAPKPAV